MIDANDNLRSAESLDEQLDRKAQELITGDSDDPPVSEETVMDIIHDSHAARLGPASWRWAGNAS
jgi:hypothetical protein